MVGWNAKFYDVSEGARRKVFVAIAIGEHPTANTGFVQGGITQRSQHQTATGVIGHHGDITKIK